jgi:hypothetical protein
MPGRLASHVHVRDAQGIAHVFTPADEIPDWAAAKITNPKAWLLHPDEDVDAPQQPPEGDGSTRPAESATKDIWQAYAAVLGVEIPEGATKAQIIEAVKAAEQQ